MPFTAKPMVPGDLLDASEKLSGAFDRDAAAAGDPEKRRDIIRRSWNEIVRLGWLSTMIPEERGGPGGTLLDLAAIVEGGGRNAFPLPVGAYCGVAPILLSSLPPSDRGDDLLGGILEATAEVQPLLAALSPWETPRHDGPIVAAAKTGHGYVLNGGILGVDFVESTTCHAVACLLDGGEAGLFAIPAGRDGITIHPRRRVDGRLSADLHFADVAANPDDLVARGAPVDRAAERALGLGTVLTCVETIAAMGAAIEQTITYLSNRVQFGVELSTFQVLRHAVADMYVAHRNARALVDFTLRKAALGDGLPWREIGLAKFRVGEVGRLVAENTIQLHGGMGMTEEVLASRLATRLLMADVEYGDRMFHAERLLAARAA